MPINKMNVRLLAFNEKGYSCKILNTVQPKPCNSPPSNINQHFLSITIRNFTHISITLDNLICSNAHKACNRNRFVSIPAPCIVFSFQEETNLFAIKHNLRIHGRRKIILRFTIWSKSINITLSLLTKDVSRIYHCLIHVRGDVLKPFN